jgi:translation initiation factor IF-2
LRKKCLYFNSFANFFEQQEYLDLIPDQYVEAHTGRATIKKVFNITVGKKSKQNIAGCGVIDGKIEKGEVTKIRVYRNEKLICEDFMDELRVQKDLATSVSKGFECGIRLRSFEDFKVGDELECVVLSKIPKTVDWVTEMVEKSRLEEV